MLRRDLTRPDAAGAPATGSRAVTRFLGALGPVKLVVWLGAIYGIIISLLSITSGYDPAVFGPAPWLSAVVTIVLMLAMMIREPIRTLLAWATGPALLLLDIVHHQPEGNSGIFAVAAVVTLALYHAYLGRRVSFALWCVLSVAYGIAAEQTQEQMDGMTIEGIVPMLVVTGVTGAAVSLVIRRRREAERELAALAERRRRERVGLARELHDSVARDLTIITMQSAVLRTTDRPEDHEVARAAIEETARSGLDALKRLLVVLRAEDAVDGPSLVRDLESESLHDAIDDSARHLTMLGFQVMMGSLPSDLPRAAETTAVRVVREATTNITKHAPPGALCSFECSRVADSLVVRILNDSPSVQAARVPSTGLGLESLAERLRLLGGTISTGRSEERWVVEARIPLTPPLAGSVAGTA